VNAPARVGVVGCGVISRNYVEGSHAFDSFDVVACADLDRSCAETIAAEFDLEVAAVDELIGDPSIDVVLNLTPPRAHASVSRRALAADKHVYTEKPLAASLDDAAEIVAEADRLDLRVGSAPDTFLSSPYQRARVLIEEGAIGEPRAVSAAMLLGGPEKWHPNADLFFQAGGGPMLDMAPYYLTAIAALLGPIARVTGLASTLTARRTLRAGPRAGQTFAVAVPTHVTSALELVSGVTANLVASFEAPGQYVCDVVIYGTEATLALPDPNAFGGPVRLRRAREEWSEVPYEARGKRDTRGIGLHDMVEAIAENRPHQASGRLALHVLEVATAVLRSAEDGCAHDLLSLPTTTFSRSAMRPAPGREGSGGSSRAC
jgi:predicted dehydrogenase